MKITVQSQTIGPEKKPPRRGRKTGAAPEKRPRRRGAPVEEGPVTDYGAGSSKENKFSAPASTSIPASASPTGFSDLRPDDDISTPEPGVAVTSTAEDVVAEELPVTMETGEFIAPGDPASLEPVATDAAESSIPVDEVVTGETALEGTSSLGALAASIAEKPVDEEMAEPIVTEELAPETSGKRGRRTMSLSGKSRRGKDKVMESAEETTGDESGPVHAKDRRHLTKEEKAAKKAAERVAKENARVAKAERKAAARAAKAAARLAKKKGLPVEEEETQKAEADVTVDGEPKSEVVEEAGKAGDTETFVESEKPAKVRKSIKEKRHMREPVDDEDDPNDFIDIIYDYSEGVIPFTVLTFVGVFALAAISYFVTQVVI